MNLDEAQRQKVVEWIGQGLKLSEIQNRLISELGLTLTYMDVRLLVDDLKLDYWEIRSVARSGIDPESWCVRMVAKGPIEPGKAEIAKLKTIEGFYCRC